MNKMKCTSVCTSGTEKFALANQIQAFGCYGIDSPKFEFLSRFARTKAEIDPPAILARTGHYIISIGSYSTILTSKFLFFHNNGHVQDKKVSQPDKETSPPSSS